MTFVLAHLDWLTTSLGLSCMALMARKSMWGWVVGFVNDLVWIVLSLDRGMYGSLAGVVIGAGIKVYGIWRWRQKEEA